MQPLEASPPSLRTLLLLMALTVAGCSSNIDLSQPSSQLDFGVKAAENDLWREARFRFEKAVELNPGDPMARNNLAVAYEGAGEFEKAREAYVAALRIDQSNQYIQKNYSRFMEFYSRNRKREAEAIQSPQAGSEAADSGEPAPTLPGPPRTAAPPGEEPVVPVSTTPPPGGEAPSPPATAPASPPQPNGDLR